MADVTLDDASTPAKPRCSRTNPVNPPPGCWPFQMRAQLAAAFAGEVSVAGFLKRCGKPGGYPAGRAHPGEHRLFWLRPHLEAAIEAMHADETNDPIGGYF